MSYPIRESKAPNLYRRCPWKVQRYWNWEDGLVFCTRLAAARITNQLIYTRPISGRHSGALQFSSQDTNTHSAHFRTPSEAPHTDTHPNTAGSQDGEGWMLNRSDIFCSPTLLVLFSCVSLVVRNIVFDNWSLRCVGASKPVFWYYVTLTWEIFNFNTMHQLPQFALYT